MKVYLHEEESFPVYSVVNEEWSHSIPVDVPRETRDRWVRIAAKFEKIQEEMMKLVIAQREAQR